MYQCLACIGAEKNPKLTQQLHSCDSLRLRVSHGLSGLSPMFHTKETLQERALLLGFCHIVFAVFWVELLELRHEIIDVLPASLLQAWRWRPSDPQVNSFWKGQLQCSLGHPRIQRAQARDKGEYRHGKQSCQALPGQVAPTNVFATPEGGQRAKHPGRV